MDQYLRPDEMPITDAKKSPLALLAMTCSNIGADILGTGKPMIAFDKGKKSVRSNSSNNNNNSDAGDSRSNSVSSDNAANENASSDNRCSSSNQSTPSSTITASTGQKISFKPYEDLPPRHTNHLSLHNSTTGNHNNSTSQPNHHPLSHLTSLSQSKLSSDFNNESNNNNINSNNCNNVVNNKKSSPSCKSPVSRVNGDASVRSKSQQSEDSNVKNSQSSSDKSSHSSSNKDSSKCPSGATESRVSPSANSSSAASNVTTSSSSSAAALSSTTSLTSSSSCNNSTVTSSAAHYSPSSAAVAAVAAAAAAAASPSSSSSSATAAAQAAAAAALFNHGSAFKSPYCHDPTCKGCLTGISPADYSQAVAAAAASGGVCCVNFGNCAHSAAAAASQHYASLQAAAINSMSNPAFATRYAQAAAVASGRPYICQWSSGMNYCGKSFAVCEDLLNHLKTHTAHSPLSGNNSSSAAAAAAAASFLSNPYANSHLGNAASLAAAVAAANSPRNSALDHLRYHPYGHLSQAANAVDRNSRRVPMYPSPSPLPSSSPLTGAGSLFNFPPTAAAAGSMPPGHALNFGSYYGLSKWK